jgi:hypothetical protein
MQMIKISPSVLLSEQHFDSIENLIIYQLGGGNK